MKKEKEQIKVEMGTENQGKVEKTQEVINLPKRVTEEEAMKATNMSILRVTEYDKEGIAKELELLEKEIDAHIQVDAQNMEMISNKKKASQNLKSMIQKMRKNKFEKKNKRFNIVHKIIKGKLIYPMLWFIAKRMGPYLVKNIDDIEPTWNNNHLKMWYYSWKKGLNDMWIYMHREMNPHRKAQTKTPSGYLKAYIPWRYGQSDWGRNFAIDIWMTEMLEDSIDREWLNFSTMNLTHQMMEHYGVSKRERDKVPRAGNNKFPVYKAGIEYNPKYFLENMEEPVWKKPEEHDYDKEEQDKNNETE